MARRTIAGRRLATLAAFALALTAIAPSAPTIAGAAASPQAGTSWPASCPGQPGGIDQSSTISSAVVQSMDGSIRGCFRVPDDRHRSIHVALQAYVSLPSGAPYASSNIGNTSSTASPDGIFRLSSNDRTVRPGQRAVLSGHYTHGHRPVRAGNAIICWGRCQGGFQEQDVSLHWTSATEFHATYVVPDSPWFVVNDGQPSVHPLTSGTYAVGIECITSGSGCALDQADAQVHVRLVAPLATWCTKDTPCAAMRLSTTSTSIGNVVVVQGRAPLVTLISHPWGYWLRFSYSGLGSLPIAFTRTAGAEDVATVTPRELTVQPGETWASLHLTPVTASSWSSASSVSPTPGSPLVAWCEPGAIVITGGARPLRVPTLGVARVLATSHLALLGTGADVPCVSAIAWPGAPSHVFATFDAALRHEVPPTFHAGLFTTDGGATWHLVPRPARHAYTDFGGFRLDGRLLAAMFVDGASYDVSYSQATIATEATVNGGATWSASTLGCPALGACTVFGPYVPDNCAMGAQPQAVLIGPNHGPASGVTFKESRWITTVDSCYSQQLVSTASGLELLADPSSEFPLVASSNGGLAWRNVRLPELRGLATVGGNEDSLLLTPSDSLVAGIGAEYGGRIRLYLLEPGAKSWCPLRVSLHARANEYVTPLRASDAGLLWAVRPASALNRGSTRHLVPWKALQC